MQKLKYEKEAWRTMYEERKQNFKAVKK